MKVIEYLMVAVLIVFALFFLFPFVGSLPVFIINFVILALMAFRIPGDIKKRGLYPHYLLSTLLTTVIFILSFSNAVSAFLQFFQELMLLKVTIAVLLIYLFAHGFKLVGETWKKQEKHK
ncbi:MAG TPA: hypothetical protein VJI46_04575 [Candidatus Nanoarchaeia archaeon]|nr:hypothetical protein [Candidatus Nanoarchaeia archaeon]